MSEQNAPEEGKAKKKKADTGRSPLKKITMTLILLVVMAVFVVLLRTSFVFFLVGMLPTVVVYYVDVSKARRLYHTVMACNLAGVLPYLASIVFAHGNSPGMAQSQLGDVGVVFVMYSAAACGWLLIHGSPYLAQLFIVGFNRTQILQLEARQKSLMQEWGPEIQRREA